MAGGVAARPLQKPARVDAHRPGGRSLCVGGGLPASQARWCPVDFAGQNFAEAAGTFRGPSPKAVVYAGLCGLGGA